MDKKRTRGGAIRQIRWKKEPELDAWMRENEGNSVADIMSMFEKRWGFPISYSQVTRWRQIYGTTSNPRHLNESICKPVGTRRRTASGWLVKTRMHPEKPGMRDNWEYEQRILWTESNGEIPSDCQLVFVDGDCDNVTLENLMLVPKRHMASVNNKGWSSRDELAMEIAEAELHAAIRDANAKCVCSVCGREFTDERPSAIRKRVTCPECYEDGRRGSGKPHDERPGVCEICGDSYMKWNKRQRRCQRCISFYPKHSVENAKRMMEKRGLA